MSSLKSESAFSNQSSLTGASSEEETECLPSKGSGHPSAPMSALWSETEAVGVPSSEVSESIHFIALGPLEQRAIEIKAAPNSPREKSPSGLELGEEKRQKFRLLLRDSKVRQVLIFLIAIVLGMSLALWDG
ncbi:MAG: hypothetical protein MK135_03280 [Polyangiaceae bacterium]|nr:hypothetical protein [Polyangiaceae bacterium]